MVEGLPSGDQHPVSKCRDVRVRLSPVSDRMRLPPRCPVRYMRAIMSG